MTRTAPIVLCAALVFPTIGCAQGVPVSNEPDESPVQIPLTVTQNPRFGTYSAKIAIALGNGKPLAFGFDTGSSGLHVFADANLEAPNSGVRCTQTPTKVTYGNPPRITFAGVVCYAQLHFDGFSTVTMVPVAYLTSAECSRGSAICRIPNLHSPKAMNGYGVFGVGLTGVMSGNGSVPNPILTLPGRRGSVYAIALRHDGGQLVLGASEPPNSAEFDLQPGNVPGERYSLARTCLFVDERPINTCLLISLDTGNGVPWIHDDTSIPIPQRDGLVRPGTRLGFAPPGSGREATFDVAGTSFADSIKVVAIPDHSPLTNTSIQAFFDRIVTYDNTRGVIAIASAP
jgi:hypothetical protein